MQRKVYATHTEYSYCLFMLGLPHVTQPKGATHG